MTPDELRTKIDRAMTDLQRGYRQKAELARRLQDEAAERGDHVSGAAIMAAIDEAIREQDAAEHAAELERARRIVHKRPSADTRHDPRQTFTEAEVESARATLHKLGLPSGERAIAKHLGGSRDAVRYALGKDRRRRQPT